MPNCTKISWLDFYKSDDFEQYSVIYIVIYTAFSSRYFVLELMSVVQ